MKKSTVIMLLIVFLGSVLVVGIFGMNAVPFEKIVFMEEITPTRVSASNGEEPEIRRDADGTWYVLLSRTNFEDGLKVYISWATTPLDCTYKDVTVKIIAADPDNLPCDPIPELASEWRGALVFHKPVAVKLHFASTDKNNGATMDISIRFSKYA